MPQTQLDIVLSYLPAQFNVPLGKKENMGLKLSGDTSTSGIVTSK